MVIAIQLCKVKIVESIRSETLREKKNWLFKVSLAFQGLDKEKKKEKKKKMLKGEQKYMNSKVSVYTNKWPLSITQFYYYCNRKFYL